MKTCGKCGYEKELSEFYKKRNGHQSYCKSCNSEAVKARYQANRDSHIANVRQRNIRVIKANQDWILSHLKSHPCVDCGNSDVRVLEFDHVGKKSFNIGAAASQGWPLDKVQAEVLECEVRCANCHRIKTAERADSWRANIPL